MKNRPKISLQTNTVAFYSRCAPQRYKTWTTPGSDHRTLNLYRKLTQPLALWHPPSPRLAIREFAKPNRLPHTAATAPELILPCMEKREAVLRIRIRDPVLLDFWTWDSDPETGNEINPDYPWSYYRELSKNFGLKFFINSVLRIRIRGPVSFFLRGGGVNEAQSCK